MSRSMFRAYTPRHRLVLRILIGFSCLLALLVAG